MSHLIGIGVDLVMINRIQRHTAVSPAFAEAAFTTRERHDCAGRPDRLAGRWAAKEAVMKALNIGLGDVDPLDIEIASAADGRPDVALHRAAAARAAAAGATRVTVSISHDGPYAVAFAAAEGDAA